MASDKALGWAIFLGSILGIVIYGLLLWYFPGATLEVTAFLGIALLFGILAWIGYTMATTPPPEPIADIPDVPSSPPAGSQMGEKKGAPSRPVRLFQRTRRASDLNLLSRA
ncbi:MAG: transcriptional regulator [Thaumarchaeota archaeon]|nr:transcriptional regulator [Nitrososphaerota archaeon]